MSHPQSPIGAIVGGRYELVRKLGQGGMGEVYEARRRDLGDRVALKLLREDDREDPELRARFLREARTLAQVTSPHVVRIVDFRADPGEVAFLVMEYLEGQNAGELVRLRGPFSAREISPLAKQLFAGLGALHALGLVHRDIKPQNIMIVDGGPLGPIVKLVDFGLAKSTHAGERPLTDHATVLGTPSYMAPEQVGGNATIDARADVYGAAATFVALASGNTLYEDQGAAVVAAILAGRRLSVHQVAPELGPALCATLERALAGDRNMRHARIEDLAADVERGLVALGQAGTATVAANIAPLSATLFEPVEPVPPTMRERGATAAIGAAPQVPFRAAPPSAPNAPGAIPGQVPATHRGHPEPPRTPASFPHAAPFAPPAPIATAAPPPGHAGYGTPASFPHAAPIATATPGVQLVPIAPPPGQGHAGYGTPASFPHAAPIATATPGVQLVPMSVPGSSAPPGSPLVPGTYPPGSIAPRSFGPGSLGPHSAPPGHPPASFHPHGAAPPPHTYPPSSMGPVALSPIASQPVAPMPIGSTTPSGRSSGFGFAIGLAVSLVSVLAVAGAGAFFFFTRTTLDAPEPTSPKAKASASTSASIATATADEPEPASSTSRGEPAPAQTPSKPGTPAAPQGGGKAPLPASIAGDPTRIPQRCTTDAQCPDMSFCDAAIGVCTCHRGSSTTMPFIYCNGACIPQSQDRCGGCATKCQAGVEACARGTGTWVSKCDDCGKRGASWRLCNVRCANVDTDIQNCGACGHNCFASDPKCKSGRGCTCRAGRCTAL